MEKLKIFQIKKEFQKIVGDTKNKLMEMKKKIQLYEEEQFIII